MQAFVSCPTPVLRGHAVPVVPRAIRASPAGDRSFFGARTPASAARRQHRQHDVSFSVTASGEQAPKFRVYPKLLGTWMNDCRVFDSAMAEIKHSVSEVDFKLEDGVYKISSMQDDGKGNKVAVSFVGTPISDGVMDFHVSQAPETRMMRSREHVDQDILINDIYDASGRLVAIETLTLVDADTRIQSGQRFSAEDGSFAGSWLYKGVRVE